MACSRILGVVTLALAGLVPMQAQARIVFVNLDPISINDQNGQDPTLDSYATTGFVPGPVSGWGALTPAQRDELMFWLKEATVPFNISYTYTRPAVGPYDMLVTGTAAEKAARFPSLAGCSTVVSVADCGDAEGDNVSFMFWGCFPADQQSDMYRVAFYALTGLGFGWGLENLDASGQIGGGFTGNGLHFGDTCVPVTAALCTDHIGCAAEQQDSTADLLARLGARIDDGAPVVAITSPEPGPVNSEFTLTADVTDGFGGLTVTLDIVEAAQEVVDPVPPYEWTLNMPDGNWTLRVEVTDADGNEVAEDVELCVGDEACGLTPGTDTGGGSSSGEAVDESVGDTGGASSSSEGSGGGSSSGGSSSGDDTGSPADPSAPLEPTTFGGDSADTGCGCRHDAPRTGGVAWALLALAGLAIRRRRVTPRG